MSATHLVVVPTARGTKDAATTDASTETLSQKIRRLQSEARSMAREHTSLLRNALDEVARLSADIAEGGEAYPVGVRELSRRLAEEAAAHANTLTAIGERGVN